MITLPTAADKTTEYEDFYETTLSAPCTAADADIFVTVLPISAVGFLVLDPLGTNPEVIFYNFKGANFVRVPSVVDGEGRGVGNTTPRPYDQGTKVGMYSMAEYFEGIVTGTLMRDGFLQSRHFSASIDPNSWIGTGETWNYVGNNGQKEYQYVTAGDKTSKYSKGMKLRLPRVITAPTQCADFEASSSQYATKTTPAGMTFTDDFTCSAWIKLESYPTAGAGWIMGRNDASANNGFFFGINNVGQINLGGRNAGTTNSKTVMSVQSLPLNTWVHVAISLDMSSFTIATNKVFINGVDVPTVLTSSGTNPTALVQAGDFSIGRTGAYVGEYFDGEVDEAAVYSAILTAAQVKDRMHKQLTGAEANLVGYWKLDGNFNDTTANANHLTAQNGATAVTLDNPFKAIEYGILTGLSFSAGNTTMTLFTGTDHNAPYENLSGIAYSAARTPYGFPADSGRWIVDTLVRGLLSFVVGAMNTWYETSVRITAPAGEWGLEMSLPYAAGNSTTTGTGNMNEVYFGMALSGTPSIWMRNLIMRDANNSNTLTTPAVVSGTQEMPLAITAQAIYSLGYMMTQYTGGTATATVQGASGEATLRLKSAYV